MFHSQGNEIIVCSDLVFILNQETLEKHRVRSDIDFLYKLSVVNLDCLDILGRLFFSRTILSKTLICLSLKFVNYVINAP